MSILKVNKIKKINALQFGIACLFFLIPFLGGNHFPLSFVSIDRFWIETSFSLLLALVVVFSFMRKPEKEIPPGFVRFFTYFAPFFLVTIVAYFYSWNPYGTLRSINLLVLAAGSVYVFLNSEKKEVPLAGFVAGAFALTIGAVVQYKILFPSLSDAFKQGLYAHILKEQSGLPFGSYLYHNMLGGYFAFIFPIALYFALYKRKLVSAVFCIVSAGILAGLVLTSTRIGMGITMVILLGILVFFVFRKSGKTAFVKTAVVMLLAVFFSFILIHGFGKSEKTGVQTALESKMKTVHTQISTLNTRTAIWKNSFLAFKKSPLIGYGSGSFEYAYRKYFDGATYTSVAHSTVVKLAVETGTVGLVCFAFYLFGVVYAGRRRLVSEASGPFIALALFSGLLFSVVDFSFDVQSHVITFFVLSSVFFLPTQGYEESPRTERKQDSMAYLIFAVMACALVVSFAFTVRSNLAMQSIETGDNLQEMGQSGWAREQYGDAIKKMPINDGGHIRLANSLEMEIRLSKDPKTDRNALKREVAGRLTRMEQVRNNNAERYLTLGKGYYLLGNQNTSDMYFRKALEFYPTSAYYVHEIAGIYVINGRLAEAEKLLTAFEPAIEKYRSPHDPRGVIIYKIYDLQAELQFRKGDIKKAIEITRNNYKNAQDNAFVITSVRASQFVAREELLKYLQKRLDFFESEIKSKTS